MIMKILIELNDTFINYRKNIINKNPMFLYPDMLEYSKKILFNDKIFFYRYKQHIEFDILLQQSQNK